MRFTILVVFAAVLLGTYALSQRNALTLSVAENEYNSAEFYFNKDSPTKGDDSTALNKYSRIAAQLPESEASAPLIFKSLEKAGILHQTADQHLTAIELYSRAIRLHDQYTMADSLAFKPVLYLGNAYYFLNNYDSALYFFEKAEKIHLESAPVDEKFRLYNSLGAVYFEAGNFQQSISYFSRAIQLVEPANSNHRYISYGINSNIASALRQMNLLDSSLKMYRSLVHPTLKEDSDALLLNIGNIFIEKNMPDSALHYFSRISKDTAVNKIALMVRMAKAKYQQAEANLATQYLTRAINISKYLYRYNKNAEAGDAYKLLGDISKDSGKMEEALKFYQLAIIQSDYNFNDTTTWSNPSAFTSSFSSYAVFETLVAKAACLIEWQTANKQTDKIEIALRTYQAAFALLDYISKSFDNEQARLFINQSAFSTYTKAIDWLYGIYQNNKDQRLLNVLLNWCERSKAVTLLIGSRENRIKRSGGIPDSLLVQEKKLRNDISHLYLQTTELRDSATIALQQSQLAEKEVALSRLINQFNDYPVYYQQKFAPDTIDLKKIQEQLPDKRTTVLSYFRTNKNLLVFLVAKDTVLINTMPTWTDSILSNFIDELKNPVPGRTYNGAKDARFLYGQLIKPFEQYINRFHSLLIIPHGQLRLIPFEALEDDKGDYLCRKFTITYQQALSFFQATKNQPAIPDNSLVLSPFAQTAHPALGYTSLPASQQEAQLLNGSKLSGAQATKQAFLNLAPRAGILHLATHAVTHSDDPRKSHIIFYPVTSQDSSYKLFAADIPQIPLQHTKLLFLSACETGAGKLSAGEGVLSLTRAFAEAGCTNMITSLWKAEDKTTAYLSERFYHHWQKEENQAIALQKAKIDLLNNAEYSQYHAPSYWSHLVFVGNMQETKKELSNWLIAAPFVALLVIIFVVLKIRRNA